MTAFDKEVARQAKRLPAIRADTIAEILRILRESEKALVARLRDPSEAMESSLIRQRDAVRDAIARFEASAGEALQRGLGTAWDAGVDLLARPMEAIGVDELRPLLRIDDRALRALRNLTTDQIKGIALKSVNKINTSLGQVLVGTRSMQDAIADVEKILGKDSARRARTIVYTSVGQAYSEASDEAMRDAESLGVKLGKRWLKSGKRNPRPSHVAAHNQMVRVSQPFLIAMAKGGVEPLRFPRDPKASLGNILACGCISVPVLDGSTFGAGVISIPDDPSKPIRVVSPAARAAENESEAERIRARLQAFVSRGSA
jgi:hypothetical protein